MADADVTIDLKPKTLFAEGVAGNDIQFTLSFGSASVPWDMLNGFVHSLKLSATPNGTAAHTLTSSSGLAVTPSATITTVVVTIGHAITALYPNQTLYLNYNITDPTSKVRTWLDGQVDFKPSIT